MDSYKIKIRWIILFSRSNLYIFLFKTSTLCIYLPNILLISRTVSALQRYKPSLKGNIGSPTYMTMHRINSKQSMTIKAHANQAMINSSKGSSLNNLKKRCQEHCTNIFNVLWPCINPSVSHSIQKGVSAF